MPQHDPQTLGMLLAADLANGNWERAIEHADTIMEVAPKNEAAAYGKALALYRAQRLDEALQAAERTLKAAPDAKTWLLKGDILSAQESYTKAAACFKSARELDAGSQEAAAKKRSLHYYLKNNPLDFVRIGWIATTLNCTMLLPKIDDKQKNYYEAAAGDLHRSLEAVSGEGLPYWAGEEFLANWSKSLEECALADFQNASMEMFRIIKRNAHEGFPAPAFTWMHWGASLNWSQLAFVNFIEDLRGGGSIDPDAGRAMDKMEDDFSKLTGEIKSDSVFLGRSPAAGPAVKNLLAAARMPRGMEKFEAAHAAITAFARLMPLPKPAS